MLNFKTSLTNNFSNFARKLWLEMNQYSTHETISQKIVTRIFNELVDDNGDPTAALVRIFRLTKVDDLPAAIRQNVDPKEVEVMALTGTYGIEDAWCNRLQSQTHQAIPLSAIAVPQQIPMFQEVLKQLGIDLDQFYENHELKVSGSYKGVFYIPDVPKSEAIPAQTDFVQPYGIKSLVGFGGFTGHGESLSLFLLYYFSVVSISEEAAVKFHAMQEFIGTALARDSQIFLAA